MSLSETVAFSKSTLPSEIFKTPLIVGASVSANHSAPSPGKELALRYTKTSEIKTIAFGGQPGKEVLKSVSLNTLKDRSIIIGVDLFFWDSTKANPKESIKALEKLISQARTKNIPLVLGDIPTLLEHYQPSAGVLNKELKRVCGDYDQCYLLPLNEILHKTIADGHLLHRGRTYRLEELIPDGLHLVTPASEYLADRILSFFKS